jgi:hypothetical protein
MKTEYELSKHRFYELKHFCLQYPEWKLLYSDADGWSGEGDTTSRDGIKRADLLRYIDMVEECVRLTGCDILPYVTKDWKELPDSYRYAYRQFFWLLSRRR